MSGTPRKNEVLGKAISEHRRTLGLSKAELARRLGVSAPTILRWENGTEPPAALLPRVAIALRMQLSSVQPSLAPTADVIPVDLMAVGILEKGLLQEWRKISARHRRSLLVFLEHLSSRRTVTIDDAEQRLLERFREMIAADKIALLKYSSVLAVESALAKEQEAAHGVTTFSSIEETEVLQASVVPIRPAPVEESADLVTVRVTVRAAAGPPINIGKKKMEIVRAVGDSMIDAGITDGYHAGDVVVACILDELGDENAGELVVKRFAGTHKGITHLLSENPHSPPIMEPRQRIRVEGVVKYRRTEGGTWVLVPRESVKGRK